MCSNLRSSMHSWSTESATWILNNTAARGETVKLIPPHSTLHTTESQRWPKHFIPEPQFSEAVAVPVRKLPQVHEAVEVPWLWPFHSWSKTTNKRFECFCIKQPFNQNASLALALKPTKKDLLYFRENISDLPPSFRLKMLSSSWRSKSKSAFVETVAPWSLTPSLNIEMTWWVSHEIMN